MNTNNNIPNPPARFSVLNADVGVENGYYGKYEYDDKSKTFNFIALGNEVIVSEIRQNIDNNEIILVLKFTDITGIEKEIEFHRKNLANTSRVLELASYGVQVRKDTVSTLIKTLENSEMTALIANVHSEIGWKVHQGKHIFKAYNAVGIESQYVGDFDLKPQGSYKKWLKMIETQVLGNSALETALSIGFVSVVYGLLQKYVKTENPFFHFVGNTSTGKTTAAQLALSTACCPDFEKNSLALTWGSTDNSLIRSVCGNYGLPVLIDEASMSKAKDKTEFVYMLSSGKEKGRLDKNSQQAQSGTWATCILSTGEYAILSMSSQNAGLRMRLVEFENVNWTESAENSNVIREVIYSNYGHAAPKFAEALINLGIDEVKKVWRTALMICEEKLLKKTKLTNRIAKKYALILATARLIKITLDIKLDLDGIANFLYQNDDRNLADNSIDLGARAFELLIQEITANHNKFAVEFTGDGKGKDYTPQYELWGKIEDCGISLHDGVYTHEKYLIILTSKFDDIMKKCRFDSPKVVLHEWKSSGRLICESDRLTSREKLIVGGEKLNTYIIDISEIKETEE